MRTRSIIRLGLRLALGLYPFGVVSNALPTTAPDPFVYEDGSGWTLIELDLDVTPVPELDHVVVEGTARLQCELEGSRGPTLGVNTRGELLHWVHLEGPSGTRAELGRRVLDYPNGSFAHLRRDEPYRVGDVVEVHFACESRDEGSQFQVDSEIAFASWVEAWYPVPLGGERSLSARASATGWTRFHLPRGWDAVSNGRRAGRDGSVVSFEVDVPVARSFAAGPYSSAHHTVGERQISVYQLSRKKVPVKRHVEMMAAALAAQEERFGPYPYASYALAEVPEGPGAFYASSEQGFIMARSSAFDWEHGNLPLWAHEMAHGWWGNLVGTDGPGSILCSESLAQYSAVIAIEAIEGEEAATEFLRMSRSGYSPNQCARGYFELMRADRDRPLAQLRGGGWEHTLSDAKGHWVFHMLRRRVGDRVFFEVLRGIVADLAGRELTLDELRRRYERAAPDRALETFFTQWLDREGAPVIDLTWERTESGRLRVTLDQTQDGEPYELFVSLGLETKDASRREQVHLVRRRQTFELEVPDRPFEVLLDPDHELLIWKPEYGARP